MTTLLRGLLVLCLVLQGAAPAVAAHCSHATAPVEAANAVTPDVDPHAHHRRSSEPAQATVAASALGLCECGCSCASGCLSPCALALARVASTPAGLRMLGDVSDMVQKQVPLRPPTTLLRPPIFV